jgi:hypothetical protein
LLNLNTFSQSFQNWGEHQVARKELGRWIDQNISTTELILSSDIGAIAYYAQRHDFVDALGLTSTMPVNAIKAGNWSHFTNWLREEQPRFVADTGRENGEIQALNLIRSPSSYFAYGSSNQDGELNLYSENNSAIIEQHVPPYIFLLVRLDTNSYAAQQ